VVISDEEIDYIKPMDPDVLVAMSQPALDSYISLVDRSKAAVVVDSSLVSKIPEGIAHLYQIPLTDIAEFKLGRKVVTTGGGAKIRGYVEAKRRWTGDFEYEYQDQRAVLGAAMMGRMYQEERTCR
jgi:cell division ATPase FtsA